MARRKRRFNLCERKQYRFITPSLCSVCVHLEDCDSFRDYYKRKKKDYNNFILEMITKFPNKYRKEIVFMAIKQIFIQVVDKKSGRIEEVIEKTKLDGLDIEKKIALTKGKELYIVTHKIEPIIRIEMKQKKITEEYSYTIEEDTPIETLVVDEAETPVIKPAKKVSKKKSEPKKEEITTPKKTTKGRKKKS